MKVCQYCTVEPLNNKSPKEQNSRVNEEMWRSQRTSIEFNAFAPSRQRRGFKKHSHNNESSSSDPKNFSAHELVGKPEVRKLRHDIKRPREVDLFMDLEMLAAVWTITLAAVIQNCFKDASFATCLHALAGLPGTEVGVSSPSSDDLEPLAEAGNALRHLNGAIPDAVELHDFLCANADLTVYKEFSNGAIVTRTFFPRHPRRQRSYAKLIKLRGLSHKAPSKQRETEQYQLLL